MKRRRTPLLVTACALAVLSMATATFAQRGGGGPGGGGPGGFGGGPGGGPGGRGGNNSGSHLLTLAEDAAVWDEIKITDDQLGKVTRLRSTISKSSRAFRNKIRADQQAERDAQQQQQAATGIQVDQAARNAARDAARQAERAATAENDILLQQDTDASLKKILAKPGPGVSQFARVQQIDLQEAGPLVVSRPDVAKALNLSQSQIEQVQAIIEGMKQGQDQVDQNRRQFFDSMRQSGGFGGPGGGGPGGGGPGGGGAPGGGGTPGGGGPGGGGRRGGNNNTNNNPNAPPMTDAEREARRLQFQTAMEQMQNDSQSVRDKAVKQVSAVLTKKQKENFNKMLGKPFDLTLLNDGRGPDNPYNPNRGGRGRGPGGGGPGGGPPTPGGGGTPTVAAASTTATSTSGTTGTSVTTATKGAQTKGTSKTATKAAPTSKTAAKTATPK